MFRMDPRKYLRIFLIALAGCFFAGILALLGAYLFVASSLPRVDTLADYQPPVITRVFGDDGTVIAEFYKERRIVVPVSRLPQQLVQAFVAAEDANFYQHQGVDFVSILRAAIKNLLAGGIVQGGSTITQQVAKSLLLTPEKKFSRKFKEAILAWRMEQKLSKDDILYLYLNQIFLGHGAYGVQAASENYFDKNVEDLSLAEVAMLAGLPQAPSRYSPYQHLARAKERQKYVLGRMVQEGYITEAEAQAAFATELTIHPRVNRHVAGAAYFAEQVRRYLEQTYGEESLYTGGLQVRTTMNVAMQEAAERAVRENLRAHDKRQGYRGPQKVLAEPEEQVFLAEQAATLEKRPLLPGDLFKAVLSGGNNRALQIRYADATGEILLESAKWAGTLRVVGRDQTPGATRLPIGSVLDVRVEKRLADGSLQLALDQEPLAEGALVALEPGTGHVKTMVGGYAFTRSQFNRALQARRLPGSAIKPLIYAAALDKGYTPASVILDTPVIYKDRLESGEETEWKPKNYTEKFYGAVSVRSALTHSLNVITVKMLEDIGISYAAGYARKLGITSPMTRDLTMALGSSALTPIELATAYNVFASGGVRVSPTYITRIDDRNGRILESVDPVDFPEGPKQGQRLVSQAAERVISPETAYLITNLMESVVRSGTGARAKALDRPVAGKTGTTNDLKDAWFAGFVPQLTAVSWIGYDQERPLGKGETGSRAALPAWLAFMQEALKEMPARDFPVPDGIEFRPIDPETGLLAPEDSSLSYIEAFAPGTAPTRYALDAKRLQARDFFRLDLEDSN
jgi:penicillin-binding protein 1A